jgi:CheY-like chemotaxis protein
MSQLSVVEGRAEQMASWANEGGAAGPIADFTSLQILIVEDDAVVARLYGEVLEGMGHEVCAIVGDEVQAVAAALRYRPDLMLVDQRLAAGSGVGAVKEILATLFIPHIFVCGNPAPVRLLRPNAVVLRKPFQEAELAAAIEQALAVVEPADRGTGGRKTLLS